MTDYPTIRIKCDPDSVTLAGRAARHALDNLRVGQEDNYVFQISDWEQAFYVKRTKTGVTVRQIEGRTV